MLLTILQFASFSAIAQVYNDEGSEAYDKKDYSNAVYSYTEGIKVNCKDKDLMAELYSNRANAHLCMGEAICIFQGLEVFILVGEFDRSTSQVRARVKFKSRVKFESIFFSHFFFPIISFDYTVNIIVKKNVR